MKISPYYGLKEHASEDVTNGFILDSTLTPASENDSKYLPYLTMPAATRKILLRKRMPTKGIAEGLT